MRQADTHGIVYTPQEIVDFMCASVEEVLKSEFDSSLSQPGIQILDPCTGTGNFIVNLLQRISGSTIRHKYVNDLFCNEIMLLPYYIASLNIEHAYYERTGEYRPFEGICFADTLNLEGQQMELFSERNTERILREKAAQIMVVIGNPPYNMGQKNENENNKNRAYPVIDKRINATYAKDSKATLNNKLYDVYVKFFRWAIDRLQGRDGIVCFVSNNSFIDQIAFDGMRKHLMQDFTQIYHLDFHGNVRKNPKLSGTTHNVFGIQVGVGITVAVRCSRSNKRELYYYRVPELWNRIEKLAFLAEKGSITSIEWIELQPDEKYNWLTENMRPEFKAFLPMGTKETKGAKGMNAGTIFKMYSLGVATNRDNHAYSFDVSQLSERARAFIDIYNIAVDRLKRQGSNKDIDALVDTSNARIKWTRQVKASLSKFEYSQFEEAHIRNCLYRPFTCKKLYFDDFWNEERYKQHLFFPTVGSEEENAVIIVSDHGHRSPFSTFTANIVSDLHLLASTDGFQCFPYYTYAEDGSNRRENITDWALSKFQTKYGTQISKRDIFHYIYAILHHTQYRERYVENLKLDLPHIPLLKEHIVFETCVQIGRQLMELHLNYEQAAEYPSKWVENRDEPVNWRVEKMRLTPNKDAVVVNEWLTLAGIPHREDDPEYIVRLVGRVVMVSIKTVKLVEELARTVSQEDWLSETIA